MELDGEGKRRGETDGDLTDSRCLGKKEEEGEEKRGGCMDNLE